MINRYIIQVPMIIFLVIFSNVSFWSPKIYFIIQNIQLFVVKVQILHFCLLFFLSLSFTSCPSRNLYGAIYCQKREHSNAGFAGIPARYPIIWMPVSVRLRGKQISQIILNLWMTHAYLYSLSCPNGIAFLNTVLLFVNNHGNCKMICLCVHIHQNGHQDLSTFKVMIEKRFVPSCPSRSGPSQFCVTDMTFAYVMSVTVHQIRHVQFLLLINV